MNPLSHENVLKCHVTLDIHEVASLPPIPSTPPPLTHGGGVDVYKESHFHIFRPLSCSLN